MAYQKMYMVPAEDPALVNLFKGRLTSDPTLDTAAKLLTRKMEILNNPNTSAAFKNRYPMGTCVCCSGMESAVGANIMIVITSSSLFK